MGDVRVKQPLVEPAEDHPALFHTSTPCCNKAGSLAAMPHRRDASEMMIACIIEKAIDAGLV